jgi:hypothetical protein
MLTRHQPVRPFSRLDDNNIEETIRSKQVYCAGIPEKNQSPSKPFPHLPDNVDDK